MPFPDEDFDAVIAYHVLEHVPDDRSAMQELLRVLKPGGWAILQVPIDDEREVTFQPPTESAQQRLELFGQEDHVRIYGRDYAARLRSAGFSVTVDDFVLSQDVDRHGLMPSEMIYFCVRPQGNDRSVR
jgi:SAM-dependent methyltransferase